MTDDTHKAKIVAELTEGINAHNVNKTPIETLPAFTSFEAGSISASEFYDQLRKLDYSPEQIEIFAQRLKSGL